MGAKKKVEVPQQPPPPPNNNTILRIITSEGKEFKIPEEQITKHSPKAKVLSDNSKDSTIKLEEIDGETFEVIVSFLDLHK